MNKLEFKHESVSIIQQRRELEHVKATNMGQFDNGFDFTKNTHGTQSYSLYKIVKAHN